MASQHTIRLRKRGNLVEIVFGLVAALGSLAGVLVCLLVTKQPSGAVVFAFAAAAFLPHGVYNLLLRRRYAVTFSKDAVEIVTVFRRRRIDRSDVTGWSYGENSGWKAVVLLHLRDGQKTVDLPLSETEDPEIQTWFVDIPNVDMIAARENLKQLLADQQYGSTPEERRATLKRERWIALVLNCFGVVASALLLFLSSPLPTAIGLTPPLIAFVLALVLRNRWDFGSNANDHRPSIALLYFIPTFAALFRAVLGYRIVDQVPLMLMASLLVGVAFAILYAFRPSVRRLAPGHIGLALIVLTYGYAALVHINVQFDNSEPQVHDVAVLESTSGSRNGHLKLAPWGPFAGAYTVEVSPSLQERIPAGATVQTGLYRGLLGARWWVIWYPEKLEPT